MGYCRRSIIAHESHRTLTRTLTRTLAGVCRVWSVGRRLTTDSHPQSDIIRRRRSQHATSARMRKIHHPDTIHTHSSQAGRPAGGRRRRRTIFAYVSRDSVVVVVVVNSVMGSRAVVCRRRNSAARRVRTHKKWGCMMRVGSSATDMTNGAIGWAKCERVCIWHTACHRERRRSPSAIHRLGHQRRQCQLEKEERGNRKPTNQSTSCVCVFAERPAAQCNHCADDICWRRTSCCLSN